ncbi:MAG TPA: hypothetical protein VFZ52_11510, partial [Chryseolinea sp.]
MRMQCLFFAPIVFSIILISCGPADKTSHKKLFTKENLVAWCVVPFDSVDRTPEERAQMLGDLGFKKFAYDWRTKHLPTFPDEIAALKHHNIKLAAVWLWIDTDSSEIFD